MKIISEAPRERVRLLKLVKLYALYSILSAILCSIIVGVYLFSEKPHRSILYLVGTFLFVTTYLMHLDFLDRLRRTRFNLYWMFFRRYSPPFGSYGFLHIMISLVLAVADVLKGGYGVLAALIAVKGLFEIILYGEIRSLMVLSYLHFELTMNNIDLLVIIDPFSK
ncbi:hypothetical protein A3L04_02495 [Thermococcus chitonophagus]|uniref:Uncharacterized protein n=1 Tax=Thermococcus chitonophagus TaxID=54262 RepID=A0A160VR51_9EURY|nr:hypothetical protein [Thermococcus chitonophagus]ASJ16026.1 hypothetical protein A3L04_02495 [Thermococcus chitonophagus]CUX77272.1 hypothetical protein CHITON_0493 [Thermococcus chitonophagus]